MGVLRLAVRGSEGVVVGGIQKPEGTSDVKQWPPESAVCDVGDEQSATHVRYSPKISPKNILSLCLESALFGCLVQQNRCPPAENELRDIDCGSPPLPGMNHDVSRAREGRDSGNTRAGV